LFQNHSEKEMHQANVQLCGLYYRPRINILISFN